ncbi:hypothetical protein OESDEN_15706 [Oesophagostomum dentatum]|uniref:Uncharacterized protein n=1 Tax=Oesophagostomum dentatum TaxID=61180 RepID=A0A0B1SGX0_OESDE|nr:hypothetical protein OESDEN_15706 [Oesophagostomum dentatum]
MSDLWNINQAMMRRQHVGVRIVLDLVLAHWKAARIPTTQCHAELLVDICELGGICPITRKSSLFSHVCFVRVEVARATSCCSYFKVGCLMLCLCSNHLYPYGCNYGCTKPKASYLSHSHSLTSLKPNILFLYFPTLL